MSNANRSLLAKANSQFYLYETDHITNVERVSRDFQLFEQPANFFFVPAKTEVVSSRKKKTEDELPQYILEVDTSPKLEAFLKEKKMIGCVFQNSLDKNENIYQIFEMEPIACTTKNKIAFKAVKCGTKYAISKPIQTIPYEKYIEALALNAFYFIDKT